MLEPQMNKRVSDSSADSSSFIEVALLEKRGVLSPDGALMVTTGAKTGRSTKERVVVQRPEITADIDWGSVNQPVDPNWAESFFGKLESRLQSGRSYKMNGFVGCFPISVVSSSPWHIAFAQNMFRENFVASLKAQIPENLSIEIYHDPEAKVSDLGLKWDHEAAIVVDPFRLKVGIVGTGYAGEIKKSAFSLCNYLLPQFGIMPMHASANCEEDGSNSSVLFGLSGTGKTTLSADPNRHLIGDDEIIWSANGLSNLEGGCYAKLINLDKENEPDIFRAANRFGSILENVAFNPSTRAIDFCDSRLTENTRASYKLGALSRVYEQSREANPPRTVIFLTADAFGALPPVAKLNEWQTQYHFMSGYTAKVAGTEMGVKEPQAAFSACFGAPFMPRAPHIYAAMLAKLVKENKTSVWILNTGWTNGGYGKGDRFPIPVSRGILTAIQNGSLNNAEFITHPVFGFQVPKHVPGIDSSWLTHPTGPSVMKLAQKFKANAQAKFATADKDVLALGGPRDLH